jgi:hypothetical protein
VPFADWHLYPKPFSIFWAASDHQPYRDAGLLPLKPAQKLQETYFQPAFEEECRQSVLDNLNLLYVAFTRAEARLHFFTPLYKEVKAYRSVGHLIYSLLANNELNISVQKPDSPPAAVPGPPASRGPESREEDGNKAKKTNAVPLAEFIANPWQPAPAADSVPTESQAYGNRLHRLLAGIRYAEDATTHGRKFLERLPAPVAADLQKSLEEVLSACGSREWFTHRYEVRTETELLSPGGDVRRPDRVMLQDRTAIVLDYKTGEADPSHHEQVRDYMDILRKSGYEEVRGFLLYLPGARLEAVG